MENTLNAPLHLFEAFGIELEYMIVDRETLDVRPVADSLLAMLADGHIASDVEIGPITWSNELALHVIELKTTKPSSKFRPLPSQFEEAIRALTPHLDRLNARLLPTAMHPWMNPARETLLWPHDNYKIYRAYDRVFNCRRHGWANVQSVHLNLPFCGDEEFARLHTAVRLVLPLLPALAASSPISEHAYTGYADTRMQHYASHAARVPSLTGQLIPEPIIDEATYRKTVLEPIREAMTPLDPGCVLELEFLNARGAIARFDRGSIEIRVMDVQEYPGGDVAICAAVTAIVRALSEERFSSLAQQQTLGTMELRGILDLVSKDAEQAVIDNPKYLAALGVNEPKRSAGQIWTALLDRVIRNDTGLSSLFAPLEIIERHGTLASRIRRALGEDFSREDCLAVYGEIADCLVQWEPFVP